MTAIDETEALTPGARRLLDAASDLFYAEGIHAVGVERVAEAAGVTKKTLYDRFGSKEQLVLAYLRRRESAWRRAVARHAAAADPGIERVLSVFDAAIERQLITGAKGCSAINARAEAPPDSDDDPVLPEVFGQKAWLLETFTSLCSEAGVPDPARQAARLMLLFDGALVSIGMRTFDQPLQLARETAAEMLERATSR